MKGTGALFSAASTEWETSPGLFAALDAEFRFQLDPCATEATAKCPRYYTEADDGLALPWQGRVFVNPPFGRRIDQWVRKAYLSATEGATVVCLLPVRSDTAWWHDYVMRATEIRFMRGRPRFLINGADPIANAPFPVAVVVFRPPVGVPAISSTKARP